MPFKKLLSVAPKGFEHIPPPRFIPQRSTDQPPQTQTQTNKNDAGPKGKEQKKQGSSNDNSSTGFPSIPPPFLKWMPLAMALLFTVSVLRLFFEKDSTNAPRVTFEQLLKVVPLSDIGLIVVRDRIDALVFKKQSEQLGVEFIPNTHSAMPLGQPIARFSVGDIEAFERHLELAEIEGGISVYDSIPVRYIERDNLFAALGDLAYIVILFSLAVFGSVIGKKIAGGDILGLKMKSKIIKQTNIKTRFSDVAGLDEAKQEIIEFVEFLKKPERFTQLGAKIPRGALLTGPPGTGKTLLARAVAGEAGVPFFSMAGTDFIEVFVGVGPSRIRELFAQARAAQPAIIFIDEIDAIGGARQNQGNDERENTLNQLLVEMDGFSTQSGIIVLASTNRQNILDKALLRPGRFDRTIKVDLPDLAAREAMFQLHLTPLKLDPALDKTSYSHRLASLSPGMSGADIGNVCNEAALMAARLKKESVSIDDFEAAIERVSAGPERKTKIIPKEEKITIAHHEAGHAVAGWFLQYAHPLLKVSIVPRGESILGYARYLPKDQYLLTRSQLLDEMCMTLAGRAAEQLCFGKVSSGAANDLQRVTERAYLHTVKFGMNPKIGQFNFPSPGEPGAGSVRFYSEETAKEIDQEVRDMVSEAYQRTLNLLTDKLDVLKNLASRLMEREIINREDLIEILGPRPFDESDKALDYYDKATVSHPSSSSSSTTSSPAP